MGLRTNLLSPGYKNTQVSGVNQGFRYRNKGQDSGARNEIQARNIDSEFKGGRKKFKIKDKSLIVERYPPKAELVSSLPYLEFSQLNILVQELGWRMN